MCHPEEESEYPEYHEKRARIQIEMEILILSLVHEALVQLNLRPAFQQDQNDTNEEMLPF